MTARVQSTSSARKRLFIRLAATLLLAGNVAASSVVTLDEALDIALNRTARGRAIRGSLEVAEQNYFAKRINFYVPVISINGSLPTYAEEESFRFFYGAKTKGLYKTRSLGASSFIQLKQSLLSGGDFTVRANLTANKDRYPNTDVQGLFYDERSRQGDFRFTLDQPLLKPSDNKNDLNNRKDDLELARLTRVEDETTLRKEVTENYIGLLEASLQKELTDAKLEAAKLKADIDSSKLQDGVIGQDAWLLSSSARLDAELNMFDAQNSLQDRRRQMAVLLDLVSVDSLAAVEPTAVDRITDQQRRTYMDMWENSLAVKKAELQYHKSKRSADYAASSRGLTGTLSANYSFGRGKVETDGEADNNINTNSWDVSLNFTYPVWDGGASSASVKAAQLSAERSRLDYEKAQKAARAQLQSLLNRQDVSYRKLAVLRQQIEIAQNKLDIAKGRLQNGEISQLTYLDGKVFFIEANVKYLTELKNYRLARIDVDGSFAR